LTNCTRIKSTASGLPLPGKAGADLLGQNHERGYPAFILC
jgi:hypothetical protein